MDIRDRVYEIINEKTQGREISKKERVRIYKQAWAQAKREHGKN